MVKIALIVIVVSLVIGVTWAASCINATSPAIALPNKYKGVYFRWWMASRNIEANTVVTDRELEPFPADTLTNKVFPDNPVAPDEVIGQKTSHRVAEGTILGRSDFQLLSK